MNCGAPGVKMKSSALAGRRRARPERVTCQHRNARRLGVSGRELLPARLGKEPPPTFDAAASTAHLLHAAKMLGVPGAHEEELLGELHLLRTGDMCPSLEGGRQQKRYGGKENG